MPPTTHTDNATEREFPTALSTTAGTKNIPEPITVPMIRNTKSCNRSTRLSFAVAAKAPELDFASEKLINVSSSGMNLVKPTF
jgi:hypothetical protein